MKPDKILQYYNDKFIKKYKYIRKLLNTLIYSDKCSENSMSAVFSGLKKTKSLRFFARLQRSNPAFASPKKHVFPSRSSSQLRNIEQFRSTKKIPLQRVKLPVPLFLSHLSAHAHA